MVNNHSNSSDKDFYYKYIELIKKGYSNDSPEMIELFKSKAINFSNISEKQSTVRKRNSQNFRYETQANNTQSNSSYIKTQAQNQTKIRVGDLYKRKQTVSENSSRTNYSKVNSRNYLSHIVIEPDSGNYTLLDNQLNIVDSMHSNPVFSFLTQHHKLKKFKKQLKNDFKLYEKYCRKNQQNPDPDFKKMFKLTKYYLKLCPDADYQILELLRNNITRINPSYANYQTACAEYLYELAQFREGDSSKLPFDINFCCDKVYSKHAYIANRFDSTPNPVTRFIELYSKENNLQSDFQSSIRYEIQVPNTKFAKVRDIHTIDTYDR